jgi:hypothetical protein
MYGNSKRTTRQPDSASPLAMAATISGAIAVASMGIIMQFDAANQVPALNAQAFSHWSQKGFRFDA